MLRHIKPATARLPVAARRVWSEASALDVEHERLRGFVPGASVHEVPASGGGRRFSLISTAAPGVELVGLTLAPSNAMRGLVTHESVPLSAALRVVSHVLAAAGGATPTARAALPGLCASVAGRGAESLVYEFGDDVGGAVLAVALGRPRPGHSVLGQGTFRAAAPAWAVS